MKYFVTLKVCNKHITQEEAKAIQKHCSPMVGNIEVGSYIEIYDNCYRFTQITNTLLDEGEIESIWILQAVTPTKNALLPVLCVH